MRNKFLQGATALLTAAVLLSSMAGCSSKGSSGESSKKVTLTVEASQDMKTSYGFAFSQDNINAFEKKYPNVTVKLLLDPDSEMTIIVQTKLAAGQPSDIINYNKVSAENELGAETNFVDLSGEPWVKNLTNPSALKAPNGKIYGFSFQNAVGGMGMVYNKDIFNQLNIAVPTTYDQLVTDCQKIKTSGINPIYGTFKSTYTFQIWTSSTWGYYVAKSQPDLWNKLNTHQKKWTDVPAFLDSLTDAYNLYKNGYMQSSLLSDDYDSVPQAFLNNKNAMTFGSDLTVTDLMTKDPGINFGMFPFPEFDGESSYLTIGQLDAVYFIPNKSKHISEAKEFLDFMAQPEQVNTAQKTMAFLPSINGAASPNFDSFEQGIYTTYNKPGNTVVEMNAYMKVDVTELWSYFQDMLTGEKTPSQVLQAWDTTFDQEMNAQGISGF
jgi:raffinose/stachyose/melibiose transport system substrate-binding protein